jgi:hypothetical protein
MAPATLSLLFTTAPCPRNWEAIDRAASAALAFGTVPLRTAPLGV